MKKTIFIIAGLLWVVVVAAFSVATIKSKFGPMISGGSSTPSSLPEATRKTPAPQTQSSAVVASSPKAVFYTSVGGSTVNLQRVTASNRVSSRYTIEIAAVASQAEADNLLLQLKSLGISGFYTPSRRGALVIYRVRVGMFTSADDAAKNLLKISSHSKIRGAVTRLH
jgi:cell division septation protein DedD